LGKGLYFVGEQTIFVTSAICGAAKHTINYILSQSVLKLLKIPFQKNEFEKNIACTNAALCQGLGLVFQEFLAPPPDTLYITDVNIDQLNKKILKIQSSVTCMYTYSTSLEFNSPAS
jgi:hypothetical protein